MRLQGVVAKRTLGRLQLHDLGSTYRVEVDDGTLDAIEAALRSDQPEATPAAPLVARLAARGLVAEGPFVPVERREGSDLASLEVEPVGRCNLRCGHCFVDFSAARMSEGTFAAALDGASHLGAVELSFNGGEPLLHRRLLAWIRLATARRLRVVLFTNGTLVTEARAAHLRESGVARVVVSLDGLEAAHDALRGRGAFARACAGIRHLVRRGVPVAVTTVLTPATAATRETFRAFCARELGVERIRWSTVAPMGRAKTRADLALSGDELRAVYHGSGDAPRGGAVEAGLLSCAAGVDKLFVAADGRVYGCHLFEQVADALGDLASEPLAAIHGRLRSGPMRSPYVGFDPVRQTDCAGCPELAACRGGCRARAWRMTGSASGRDLVACARRGVSAGLVETAAHG